MKKNITEIIACLDCGAEYIFREGYLECVKCGKTICLIDGIPVFTPIPSDLQPTEKIIRGPDLGTPWRVASWRFLEETLSQIPSDAWILDIGAGRGDFADLLANHYFVALDIYPYPEVDIVCDLIKQNPFRTSSFDVVLLMNVLEHIKEPNVFFHQIAGVLKPGGLLVVAIPFFVKLHQIPFDFFRFSQFALNNIGRANGLEMQRLDGFYDVVSLLEEGLSNLRNTVLPEIKGWRHFIVLFLHAVLKVVSKLLRIVLGPGEIRPVTKTMNPAPTGYLIHYRKPR